MTWVWDELPKFSVLQARAILDDTEMLTVSVPKDSDTSLVDDLASFASSRGLLALISDGTAISTPESDHITFLVDASEKCLAADPVGNVLHGAPAFDTIAALAYKRGTPVVANTEAMILPTGSAIRLADLPRRKFSFTRTKTHPAVEWAREFAVQVFSERPPLGSAWTWTDRGEVGEIAELFATGIDSDVHATRRNGKVLAIALTPQERVDHLTKPPSTALPFMSFHQEPGGGHFVVTDQRHPGGLVIPIRTPDTICPDILSSSPAGQLLAAATILLNAPWCPNSDNPDLTLVDQLLAVQQDLPLGDTSARSRAVAAWLGFPDELVQGPARLPTGAPFQTFHPGKTQMSGMLDSTLNPLIVPDAAKNPEEARKDEAGTLRAAARGILLGILCCVLSVGAAALLIVSLMTAISSEYDPQGSVRQQPWVGTLAAICLAWYGVGRIRQGLKMRQLVRNLRERHPPLDDKSLQDAREHSSSTGNSRHEIEDK